MFPLDHLAENWFNWILPKIFVKICKQKKTMQLPKKPISWWTLPHNILELINKKELKQKQKNLCTVIEKDLMTLFDGVF